MTIESQSMLMTAVALTSLVQGRDILRLNAESVASNRNSSPLSEYSAEQRSSASSSSSIYTQRIEPLLPNAAAILSNVGWERNSTRSYQSPDATFSPAGPFEQIVLRGSMLDMNRRSLDEQA
jgi:hypothetical protein